MSFGNSCRALAAIAVACVLTFAPDAAAAASGTPQEFVSRIGAQALRLLRRDHQPARVSAEFRRLIVRSFDLPLMGRFILGEGWNLASPSQRADYSRLFADYVLAINARRLARYAGGALDVTEARTLDGGDIVVESEVVAAGAAPVTVHWRLRAVDGRHKVIDLIVAGASLLVTQRDEFAAIVRRDGVDGLIELLRRHTAAAPAMNESKGGAG